MRHNRLRPAKQKKNADPEERIMRGNHPWKWVTPARSPMGAACFINAKHAILAHRRLKHEMFGTVIVQKRYFGARHLGLCVRNDVNCMFFRDDFITWNAHLKFGAPTPPKRAFWHLLCWWKTIHPSSFSQKKLNETSRFTWFRRVCSGEILYFVAGVLPPK